jgi:membrane-bound metal-dependent hydrolase YbcI (DUF457 family)
MDPLTHVLTSFAIYRAAAPRHSRFAAPLLVTAGVLPDLDLLSFLAGPRAFVIYDGALTHSLLGAALLAAAVGILFFLLARNSKKDRLPLSLALGLSALGVAAHLALDLCGTPAVRLLWPFSQRQFACDFVPIFDPLILLLLLAGLLLPALAKLVSEEIGERRKTPRGITGARIALTLLVAFLAARAVLHQRAVTLLLSSEYHGAPPLAATALPSLSLLTWHGIVDTGTAFEELPVPLGPAENFDPVRSAQIFKPHPSPALDAATGTRAARAFLAFARIPLASVQPAETGAFQFDLRDLSNTYQSNLLPKPIARIELAGDFKVLTASFHWQSSRP